MFKIKVIRGTHRIGPQVDKETGEILVGGTNVKMGGTFTCKTDLSKKYPEKFQLVGVVEAPEAPVNPAAPDAAKTSGDQNELQGMTKAALETLAEEGGIDISNCKTKADLIAAIQLSMAS